MILMLPAGNWWGRSRIELADLSVIVGQEHESMTFETPMLDGVFMVLCNASGLELRYKDTRAAFFRVGVMKPRIRDGFNE